MQVLLPFLCLQFMHEHLQPQPAALHMQEGEFRAAAILSPDVVLLSHHTIAYKRDAKLSVLEHHHMHACHKL